LLYGKTLPFRPAETPEENIPATEPVSLRSEVSVAAGSIKMRAARPLLARLTIRPPVAAAVTAAGEAIGHQTETLLGSVSNLSVIIMTFLYFDYMFSQVDTGLHRPGLEAEIHKILNNEHQRLRAAWLTEEQTTIATRMAQIHPFLNGEVNPPPSSVPTHVVPETAPLSQGQ
jgi:hypothetical protein